jgi:hypothetical protein
MNLPPPTHCVCRASSWAPERKQLPPRQVRQQPRTCPLYTTIIIITIIIIIKQQQQQQQQRQPPPSTRGTLITHIF